MFITCGLAACWAQSPTVLIKAFTITSTVYCTTLILITVGGKVALRWRNSVHLKPFGRKLCYKNLNLKVLVIAFCLLTHEILVKKISSIYSLNMVKHQVSFDE